MKDEQLVYMDDYMYLPIEYKGKLIDKPFYKGNGNHSVKQLEEICQQFNEYCHQQAIIKQNAMKHLIELKFGIEFAG